MDFEVPAILKWVGVKKRASMRRTAGGVVVGQSEVRPHEAYVHIGSGTSISGTSMPFEGSGPQCPGPHCHSTIFCFVEQLNRYTCGPE